MVLEIIAGAYPGFLEFVMPSSWRRPVLPLRSRLLRACNVVLSIVAFGAVAAGCRSDPIVPVPVLKLSSIVIAGGGRQLERGTEIVLTATARDSAGQVVPDLPLAWRSSADSIATVSRDGKVTAKDTGTAVISASALGVVSGGIGVRVVWLGAASVAAFQYVAPIAVSPNVALNDSVRVQVTTLTGGPAPGTLVAFRVTTGGGTVSPRIVTTGQNGVAAAQWILGATAGTNSLTATVVGADSATAVPWVKTNPVVFTVKSYAALVVAQGDNQTGLVLSPLSVPPSVKLVDDTGKPRAGIPVTFTATANGSVASAVISTASDGVASPGVWTLGDTGGDQQLIATVESAKLVLHATATGSIIPFAATIVATAQSSSCARTSDGLVSCFGQHPQIGTGNVAQNQSKPTPTFGGIKFATLSGGNGHFCGTAAADASIYCWGLSALVDTTGAVQSTTQPTRLPSALAWMQTTPGATHNCALTTTGTAYCWGFNAQGELGDNTTINHFAPQQVAGGFTFTAISAGRTHECGVASDASAFCWGSNASGEIGDNTTTNRLAPTAVSGASKWLTVAAGQGFSCGLTDKAIANCWGAINNQRTPTAYAGAPTFSSLNAGALHTCALTPAGAAYCWGDNAFGQLGDSTRITRTTPTAVVTQMRFTSLAPGFQHTCGLTTDGLVACWGRNQFGELALSTPIVQLTPRLVALGVKP